MKYYRAFTLAEVLITLGIIGIVASMTIPTLITNYNQRAWDTGASVFNRRLGEALRVMNSQSALAGYTTTKAFVDELSKHIKIVKTCDSDKLADCFISEFYTNDSSYKVEDLKKSRNLNNLGKYNTETIGVVFNDGVSALIAYNPKTSQDPYSNQIINITGSGNNVGLGTDAIAILYDVSSQKNPNHYGTDDNGKLKDIRGINVSIKTGDAIVNLGTNYSPINCKDTSSEDYKYCQDSTYYTEDYWAGAQKACEAQGLRLPTKNEMVAYFRSLDSYETVSKIFTDYGGYWLSDNIATYYSYYFPHSNSSPSGAVTIQWDTRNVAGHSAMCME